MSPMTSRPYDRLSASVVARPSDPDASWDNVVYRFVTEATGAAEGHWN